MKYISIIIVGLFIITTQAFSQKNISIEINLKNIRSKTCDVKVDLSKAEFNDAYLFPNSIPGTYEKRNFGKYNSNGKIITAKLDTVLIKKVKNGFNIPDKNIKILNYKSTQSMNPYGYFYPEDTYFSDSVLLLNWNVLVGYFENTSNSYEIKLIKPKEFFGTTSMSKESINDTIDVYTASNYSELIHSPIMYSKADTVSFLADECPVKVSIYCTLPKYNSANIKQQIKPVLEKCLSDSYHTLNNYCVICIIDNFKISNSLIALEHPNSTVVCMPTSFKDTTVLSATIAHEFCHALYTPLYVRSKLIEQFNYQKPLCDEHLWFYEGCIEYLSRKKSFQSNVIDTLKFIQALHSDHLNMRNINLLKTSQHVYSKKGQKNYMNFYTKGSLVAFLLDLEIIKNSNYKMSLSSLMIKLQKYQEMNGAFAEDNFLNLFSQLSKINLSPFFERYLNSKEPIDFDDVLTQINYRIQTNALENSMQYSYSISVLQTIFNNGKLELVLKKSGINEQLKIKKIIVTKIDSEEICQETITKLMYPDKKSIELTILDRGEMRNVTVVATLMPSKKYERVIQKLKPNETELSTNYWKL